MEARVSRQPSGTPSRSVPIRKPLPSVSRIGATYKGNSLQPKTFASRLPWLDESRRLGSHSDTLGSSAQNDRSKPETRCSDRSSHFSEVDTLNVIKSGDARRSVQIVDPLDGNNASTPTSIGEGPSMNETSPQITDPPGKHATGTGEKLLSPKASNEELPSSADPTIRLASLIKELKPTDSTGSRTTGTRTGSGTNLRESRNSVSETTTMRPTETLTEESTSRKRPSPEDNKLHDSITKLEELTREAVYLAHDAVDRQRPEEVPRIIDEAAQALHSSTHAPSLPRELRDEPLLDAGGAVPWPNALHSPHDDDDDVSTFSRNSSEANNAPTFQSLQPNPTASTSQPFKNEPSPYHPPDIAKPTAIDFAYPNRAAPEQISPTSTPPIDVRRRSKPKARFEEPVRQENVRGQLPTSPDVRAHIDEYGEPPYFPRNSSITVRRPRESSSSSSVEVGGRLSNPEPMGQVEGHNWGRDKYNENDYLPSDALKGKHHVTLGENQKWSIHHHRRQPVARNWSTPRKRATALTICINTALIGFVIGIYAGEVPAIQYSLNDLDHHVILGNVMLYIGMAVTTFFFWPLPLLHGRKPYTLVALSITLPLQFPQAIVVSTRRVGNNDRYMAGLLISRAFSGLALGFCHINMKTTLLDLFGASLQSTHPHGEIVMLDDVRRHGGGMGLWLGFWSFSFIGSLAFGFMIGADIISGLNVSWGFYITVILIAVTLLIDVLTPETRRSPHRRTMAEIELPNMRISRRVARGEVKMHVYGDGPKWWWEEVFAGVYLSLKMLDQPGFGLMALYLGWVYGEIVLIIVLLGNLLSVGYVWRPEYVGLGALSIFVGALLAVPNTKANFFSKSRVRGGRTDSMTFEPRLTWTSHMVRRAAFMILLPAAGVAYTLASAGSYIQYMVPIIFSGLIGYISNLAIAECHGLIMETFDTSDLQPGANSKHRLQSLPAETRSRRTAYSSYPRITAGFMISHTIGFAMAALATGVGGAVTRSIGAQKATGITAGVLFGLTILLTMSLWRFKKIQVIPNHLFGGNFESGEASGKRDSLASMRSDKSWRAIVIGNPSGKVRRMNLLELGGLSRWTEIRRLNRLLNRSTTQALNPGWQ